MSGAHGGAGEFGDHLRDGEAVVFADVVEEAHGVVLDHHVVRGESFLNFVHPSLHYISTPLTAEMLFIGGVCVCVCVCVCLGGEGRGWCNNIKLG